LNFFLKHVCKERAHKRMRSRRGGRDKVRVRPSISFREINRREKAARVPGCIVNGELVAGIKRRQAT
jgi:hypothetical protein